MKLLHTEFSERFLATLSERLARLDPAVELAPLGSVPSPALVVTDTLTPGQLELARSAGVSWIQAVTAGVEHVLIPELVSSDITLTSSGGPSVGAMAEFVFARILEHAKRLPLMANQQRDRLWKTVWSADLAGATLAVVGLGPIGRRVAELGKAFGMTVAGVRARPEVGPGPCDEVFGPGSLADVLGRADYVVLAPALTPRTRGLIGAAELAAMKEGALLVNVGRGDLVDEPALLEAAGSGRITAALDVAAREPLPEDDPLWTAQGVRISPHCSAITPSLFGGLADFIADNVRRFMNGEALLNVVDKSSGYPLA